MKKCSDASEYSSKEKYFKPAATILIVYSYSINYTALQLKP